MKKIPLTELCRVIRSKNAGPFELTLDLIFKDQKTYEQVKKMKAIEASLIARLYHVPEEEVLSLVYFDPALAVKATIKRPAGAGSLGETDVYGAQQHAPLLGVQIEMPPDFDRTGDLV